MSGTQRGQRFVVTGGCGFIGSHLVEHLAEMGHAVVVIDDLSAGHLENIAHVRGDLEVHLEKVERFAFAELPEIAGVFHLAAQASVPYSVDHFIDSSSTNLLSTFSAIDFCTQRRIPLVYATSSAVYGNLPFGAESGAVELLSPYAADKYCMEMYTQANFNLRQARSFGLRFFNVYGPRQDASNPYSGVISLFIDRMLRGDPITVNGGYQTRDFVYVGDVVKCIWSAYEYLLREPAAAVANVLTGVATSIDALVACLAEILQVTPTCTYRDLPPGDPERSNGSTDVMERLLNVRAEHFVDVRTGLVRTVDSVRSLGPVGP